MRNTMKNTIFVVKDEMGLFTLIYYYFRSSKMGSGAHRTDPMSIGEAVANIHGMGNMLGVSSWDILSGLKRSVEVFCESALGVDPNLEEKAASFCLQSGEEPASQEEVEEVRRILEATT